MNNQVVTNEKMTVGLGEVFKIELSANETTGYVWALAKLPPNLYLLNEVYSPESGIGIGGTKTFYFKAIEENMNAQPIKFLEMAPWGSIIVNEQSWKIEVDRSIKYEVVTNYYADDVEEGKQYLVIDNLRKFSTSFYPAAVIGPHKWLTLEDFTENIVVAMVEPAEYQTTKYTIEKLVSVGDTLEVRYKLEKKNSPVTKFRFCKILLAAKGEHKSVAFIENGVEKAVKPILS